MNTKSITAVACLALLVGACGKSPTTDSSNNQPPPAVQAEPFHGQVYKSLNGRTVLTLVSKDECEIAESGTTYLCKYTKQTDALRVVVTALGTTQVIYYRFTNQGIIDNDGNVLFSPEQYAAIAERIKREKDHAAEVKANSTRETAVILTKELFIKSHDYPRYPDKLTLTDVSVKLHLPQYSGYTGTHEEITDTILFSEIASGAETTGSVSRIIEGTCREDGSTIAYYYFYVTKEYVTNKQISFKTEAEANSVRETFLNTLDAWKKKFPDAVL